MKENLILNKDQNDQNVPNPKQTTFISNTEQNISTNHPFRTTKKRIPWTETEDKSIKSLVNKYGTSNWTLIAKHLGQNRSGKQCRERWYNQLNPEVKKNNWTDEEENILFTKNMHLGNKWADIASFLPGRTLNDIKNHFYSNLRKFIRKKLKQINDENLFKINGIDACKYNAEKIYKLIKKYKVNYENLTKDTILEVIIAAEKNPKGQIIFFNDNSNNMEYNSSNSNIINNIGNNLIDINDDIGKENNLIENKKFFNNIFNNNLFMNLNNHKKLDDEFENINKEINNNIIINNKNNSKKNIKYNLQKNEDNKKGMQFESKIDTKNGKNIIKREIKSSKNIIKDIPNNHHSELIGQKRKKNNIQKADNINDFSQKKNKIQNILDIKNSKKIKNNQEKFCHNLLLIKNKSKENNNKRKIKDKNNKNDNDNPTCGHEQGNNDDINKKKNEIKFMLKKNKVKEKIKKNNRCFCPAFKISTPKTTKNIFFPSSETKSNKSLKPEDFSFNKMNLLNDYLDTSQMQQIFPVTIENILLCPQKNKNLFISDLSYDNNIIKSRGSCLGSVKNDNTYKNFSIDGNIYNKIITQNNNMNNFINNMTIKSIEDNNILEEKNDMTINNKFEKPNINLDLINHQDFTNTVVNGNIMGGNESQYNSIFNKNNQLNICNSSPSSMKSIWK